MDSTMINPIERALDDEEQRWYQEALEKARTHAIQRKTPRRLNTDEAVDLVLAHTHPGDHPHPCTHQSAKDRQVGGDHYAKQAIQPIDYIIKNNLGFCEGNIIKYVTRYKDKGGVDDLRKAKHYIDLLIELIGE